MIALKNGKPGFGMTKNGTKGEKMVEPGQVKIHYSSTCLLASWPGEHVFQALETCHGFISRWELDGAVVQVMPFVNINDCIRATVRLEIVAKERS